MAFLAALIFSIVRESVDFISCPISPNFFWRSLCTKPSSKKGFNLSFVTTSNYYSASIIMTASLLYKSMTSASFDRNLTVWSSCNYSACYLKKSSLSILVSFWGSSCSGSSTPKRAPCRDWAPLGPKIEVLKEFSAFFFLTFFSWFFTAFYFLLSLMACTFAFSSLTIFLELALSSLALAVDKTLGPDFSVSLLKIFKRTSSGML